MEILTPQEWIENRDKLAIDLNSLTIKDRRNEKLSNYKILEFAGIKVTDTLNKIYYWWLECANCGYVRKTSNLSAKNKVKTHSTCDCETKKYSEIMGYRISYTHEYNSFVAAKSRCQNNDDDHYINYGFKGIEFKFNNFLHFIECVGYRPSAKCSLDRIDNSGHYEPGNCKWSTPKEQARNRRDNRKIVEYNLKNEPIAVYRSITSASEETSVSIDSIQRQCRNERFSNKYISSYFRYFEPEKHNDLLKTRISRNRSDNRSVTQYDLAGNYIQHFSCPTEAEEKTGIPSKYIDDQSRKKGYGTKHGSIFRFSEDEFKPQKRKLSSIARAIDIYDKNSVFIKTVESACEAARITNLTEASVRNCIQKRYTKTRSNYLFRYQDESIKIIAPTS